MAQRVCFVATPTAELNFVEIKVEFKYYTGFSISQKQRSIHSMHDSIKIIDDQLKVLEVSTKSEIPIGRSLSAFNLKFFDDISRTEYPIENVFQSSKVFENGGPYRDLLYVSPKDAKRDERLLASGKLKHFELNGTIWGLEPKTLFYDWLYISALYRDKKLSAGILDYNAFTDIEFNPQRSVNCQARSAAIFVSLSKKNKLEQSLVDYQFLKTTYRMSEKTEQIRMT